MDNSAVRQIESMVDQSNAKDEMIVDLVETIENLKLHPAIFMNNNNERRIETREEALDSVIKIIKKRFDLPSEGK